MAMLPATHVVLKDVPYSMNEEITVIFPRMKRKTKGIILYDKMGGYSFYILKNDQYVRDRQLCGDAHGHYDMDIWTSDGQLWSCYEDYFG